MLVGRITRRCVAAALLIGPGLCNAQEQSVSPADSSLDSNMEAGEASVATPKRSDLPWNEFDASFFTLRVGGGLLYDGAVYVQDDDSKQQFDLEAGGKFRDFRLLLKGRLKFERSVTWTCGIMYDGPTDSWLFRETGIMVAVPELWGHLFIGRTKEGFSLNKVMTGYAGWTMERATITDATIPILADGVKWLGYLPNRRLLWNIGWYNDWLSQGQSFSTYKNQFVVRVVWLAMLPDSNATLLHLGLNGRYGEVLDGKLQLRSRPEVFLTPYFVDTGKFPADHTFTGGWEAYYRTGPFLFGTEYFLQKVPFAEAGNPLFHGGDVAVTWLITGETREYNTVGGYFKAISPVKTVFEGGPGAWEAVLRISYIDLDSGNLRGGKFWRVTPMINWHMSDNVRLEFAYGYGNLTRFDLNGVTHFFQGRIQTQL